MTNLDKCQVDELSRRLGVAPGVVRVLAQTVLCLAGRSALGCLAAWQDLLAVCAAKAGR